MRPSYFLIVFVVFTAFKPDLAMPATDTGRRLPADQLESLLDSEFAFQSGEFSRAFSHYKNRPIADLSPDEAVRGGQLAVTTGDFNWLKALLNTQSVQTSSNPELLLQRFAEGIRSGNPQAAMLAWQGLNRLADGQGIEPAREQISTATALTQPTLNAALALYSAQAKLSEGEIFELYQFALQWQQNDLAVALLARMNKTGNQAKLADLMKVCLADKKERCTGKIDAIKQADFDVVQQQTVLALAQQTGNTAQAYKWLSALPQDGGTYYQRIVLLGRNMDKANAQQLAAEIERDAYLNDFQRPLLSGSLAELQKNWQAAEAFYREALALNTPTTASIRLAVVLLRQNKQDQAFASLHAIQADGSLSDEIRREAFLTELQFNQIVFNKDGLQQRQTDVLQRALLVWPYANRIRYQYAMNLFAHNQLRQAMIELEKITEAAPADADALNAYAYTLAKELDRPRQALKPIQQAFMIAPERGEILDSYGYILFRLGRNAEARIPLEKAWMLTPSAVTASHLAQLYLQLGDKQSAQDYLQKGLQLDANEAELLQLQEQLR